MSAFRKCDTCGKVDTIDDPLFINMTVMWNVSMNTGGKLFNPRQYDFCSLICLNKFKDFAHIEKVD